MSVVGKNPSSQTEVRIARIVAMHLAQEWKQHVSAQALAREWGIGITRVYEIARKAKERLQVELAFPAQKLVFELLEEIARKGSGSDITFPGDLSARVSACKELGDIAGLKEMWKRRAEEDVGSGEERPAINIHYHASAKPADVEVHMGGDGEDRAGNVGVE